MSKDLSVGALLDCYGPVLHEKPRYLMECYYHDDLSLTEIAENEGMTRQGVHDAVKRGEAQLEEMERLLRFCAQTDALRRLAAEYRRSADPAVLEQLLCRIESM